MPTHNYTTQNNHELAEDEIDLRELFATIWRYKKSIIFITLVITIITAIIAYRMPKYYKSTTVIEVKPKAGEGQGFSLGGAGALLGLSGGASSNSIDKDASLLEIYRTNKEVINNIDYSSQYYIYEKFRFIELKEDNCSISISDVHIPDYKNFGIEISFDPISADKFRLSAISRFFDKVLGEYTYGTPIHTEYFDLIVHKSSQGATPSKIKLNADKHYIFDQIVSKNLSSTVNKKNPFITIDYLDTLPQRGEAYIKSLIANYIDISIGFEIEDADITLDSLNKQISEIEEKVKANANEMEKFKSDKKLISPEAQAQVLIKGQAVTEEQLIQNRYQQDIVKDLIAFTNKNKNIDAIAPSLIEFNDQPTISLITKLQELQLEATSLAQEFKAAYPKLKSTRNQIRTIKTKIKSNLKNLQKTLITRSKSLQKLENDYIQKLKQAPTSEKEMTNILRNYTFDEKLYAYLLQKKSTAEIKKAEAISRFRVIEPIYTSPRAAKPKKALILVVGFITALILSIFIAFLREFLRGDQRA